MTELKKTVETNPDTKKHTEKQITKLIVEMDNVSKPN